MQKDSVEVLCFDIIHAGILALIKHTMRAFESFAVEKLISANYSTPADHLMIAGDTHLQDGVSHTLAALYNHRL